MKTPKILVLVPLKLELQLLIKALEKEGFSFLKSQKGRHQIWRSQNFIFACSGKGKVQTALNGQDLIQNFEGLKLLICLGSGGSLVDLNQGQIVVATKTIEHDHITKFGNEKRPHFAGAADLLNFLKNVDFKNVVFAPIASGDEDVLDPNRALEIQAKTKATVVAWEGAGAARLASFIGIDFLELRLVTDGCSIESLKGFKKDLQAMITSSAQDLADLLKKIELQSEIS